MSVDTAEWVSSSSAAEIADWLAAQARVLLLTHTKPDGDAMGSTLALARALNLRAKNEGVPGVTATPWYAGIMPSWSSTLAGGTRTRHEEADGLPDPANFEAIAICDTGSWGQLAPFADALKAAPTKTCIVDHHLQGDAEISERRLLDTDAAAVVQPVAEICCRLLGVSSPAELPRDIATPLYFGLSTDTGWFRHSNVGPRVFTLASQLHEAGVDHGRLHAMSEQTDREPRVRLLGRTLSNMRTACDGRLAVMPVTVQDLHDTKAGPGDTGGFQDPVLCIAKVRVVVVLTEVPASGDEPARVKLSFRSKPAVEGGPGLVDVNQLAQTFGGGGHAQAAGARPEGSIDEVIDRVIAAATPAIEAADAP